MSVVAQGETVYPDYHKEVTVVSAGTLGSLIPKEERSQITHLKVNGPINGDDYIILREMMGFDVNHYLTNGILLYLDLEDAHFRAGGSQYNIDYQYIKPTAEDDWCTTYLFENSYTADNLRLETVILPKTCKGIKNAAFCNILSLKHVVLGEDTETIEMYAFKGCTNLQTIDLKNVKDIKAHAFTAGSFSQYTSGSVENIVVPATCTHIGWDAFNWPTLKDVKIEGYLDEGAPEMTISPAALVGTGVEKLVLPDRVTSFDGGGELMADNKYLKELVLEANVCLGTKTIKPNPTCKVYVPSSLFSAYCDKWNNEILMGNLHKVTFFPNREYGVLECGNHLRFVDDNVNPYNDIYWTYAKQEEPLSFTYYLKDNLSDKGLPLRMVYNIDGSYYDDDSSWAFDVTPAEGQTKFSTCPVKMDMGISFTERNLTYYIMPEIEKEYGDEISEISYTKEIPAADYSETITVNPHDFPCDISCSDGLNWWSHAGEYDIFYSKDLESDERALKGSLTVTKAPLTVSTSDIETEFGTPIGPDGIWPEVTVTGHKNLVFPDGTTVEQLCQPNVTINLVRQEVGSYVIPMDVEFPNGEGLGAANFYIVENPGTYTVTPGNQTIEWNVESHSVKIGDQLELPVKTNCLITLDEMKPNIEYQSSDESVAPIENNLVKFIAPGEVTITASQSGNHNFYPAENVSHVFTVSNNSTGVDNVFTEADCLLEVANGILKILNAGQEIATIHSIDGRIMYSGFDREISLIPGIYIVTVGNTVKKIKI